MEFNQNYALTSQFADFTQITANQRCLSRNELRTEHWNYNLYYNTDGQFRGKAVSAGQRVDHTSRIDFNYQGNYGSIAVDWQWLENNDVLPDGAVISDTDNTQQYTAHVAYGALNKYSLDPQLLSDLKNQSLTYWGMHPSSTIFFGKWILNVDPVTNDFVFDKIIISTPNGEVEASTFDHDKDTNTPEIDVAAILPLTDGDLIDFRDQSNNNYVYVYNAQTTPADRIAKRSSSKKINIANTRLFPNAISEITLYCYVDCPLGGLTQNDVDAATSINTQSD